jgi:23S rRNA-/tRNA-specific pseudouridylate synthase
MNVLTGMKNLFITAGSDIPLRRLLEDHLPPGSKIETIIAAGGAWKDKHRIYDPERIIRAQETVKVYTSSFQGKTYTLEEQRVIFENQDLLIVYKPGDLNVHAVPSSFFYNLTYGVNRYLERQGVRYKATPLSRLDRPVEGLVIFAKNKASEKKMYELVKQRKIKKWYMAALEHRDPGSPRYLGIRDKISNDGNRTFLDENGKVADSLFIKTVSGEFADIYSIFTFTGRRHQIRFHASHYIAPIVGDWFYGSAVKMEPDNIALVCRGYNIPYKGENLRVRIPAHYLEEFLRSLT